MNPSLSSRRIAAVLFSSLLLLLCLIYIYRSFQWREIAAILAGVNLPWLLGGAALSTLLYWLVRTLRWFVMLKSANIHIKFSRLYMCSAITVGLSVITPFQSGEMLKIEWLKKQGHLDRLPGYGSFMVERFLDLFVICTMAALSLLFQIGLPICKGYIPYLFFGLAALPVAGLFLLNRLSFGHHAEKFLRHVRRFLNNAKILFLVTALTCLSWVIVALGWHICLRSLSIAVGFHDSLALMSIMTVINIASLIPGAVGVSEVGITEYLIHLGHPAASAQAGAVILRGYSMLIVLLALLHFLSMKIGNFATNDAWKNK